METDKLKKSFGQNVRKLRRKKGLTQEELGRRANLMANLIGFVERGGRNVTLKNIGKIAKGLGCPLNKLFQGF